MRAGSAGAAALATAAVFGATWAGSRFSPRRPRTALWYASLRKPSYTPPGPAIGAVWSGLDMLLAFAGARLIARRDAPGGLPALAGWTATVLGLVGYPAAFFGARRTGSGLAASAAMCAAATAATAASSRVDVPASAALAPVALWTAFATILSEELWRRN